MAVDLDMVYSDTVMYSKLQLDNPMSSALLIPEWGLIKVQLPVELKEKLQIIEF